MGRKVMVVLAITSIMLLLMFCPIPRLMSVETQEEIITYLYPIELKKGDIVSDGKYGSSLKIESDTLFIWIDLMPDARFAHPTKYIFIRDHKEHPVLVHDGQWWPYLNENSILYGSANKNCLISPYQLDQIKVYLYPIELKEGDIISDGGHGVSLNINCDTLFIWIDLMPNAYFAHPTKYIFIRAQEKPVLVADGKWWPYLNGNSILYGSANLGAVISPFHLPSK